MQYKKTELAIKLENLITYNGDDEVAIYKYPGLNFTPKRATEGSNGYDLRCCSEEPVIIFPDEVVKIGTGVHVWLGSIKKPIEEIVWTGLLVPRSSNKGCILNNTIGILDNDYQGELFMKWRNVTAETITFEVGQAFAQLVIVPSYIGSLEEAKEFHSITSRGENGFGSTGK